MPYEPPTLTGKIHYDALRAIRDLSQFANRLEQQVTVLGQSAAGLAAIAPIATDLADLTSVVNTLQREFRTLDLLPVEQGGTGLATYAVGDLLYANAPNSLATLPGNTTSTQKFLTQTGTGSGSAAPSWQPVPAVGSLVFFFFNTASDIVGYLVMKTPASLGADQTVTTVGLAAGSTTLASFATLAGVPSVTFVPAGVCTCYVTARQSGGTKITQLFAEFYHRTSAGVETLVATSALTIPLTGVNAAYIFQGAIATSLVTVASDRLVCKVRASVSGGGSAPDVVITFEGVTAARSESPSATVDATNFVPYSGATANIDLGVRTLTTSGVVTAGSLTLTTDLTVPNGGTGVSTFASNGVVYGAGAGALAVTAQGGANTVLTANAGAPAFSTTPTLTTLTTTGLITAGASFNMLAGNACIGHATASVRLDVRGTGVNDGGKAGIGNSDGTDFVSFYGGQNNDAQSVMFWSAGNTFKYGTATAVDGTGFASYMELTTAGAARMNAYGAGAATFDASGNITSVSDERHKTISGPFLLGLPELLPIQPILYRYTRESGMDVDNIYAGFSAQNVLAFIPEAVGKRLDGFYTLNDRALLAAVVNAIRELTQEVDVLRGLAGQVPRNRTRVPIVGDARAITSKPQPPVIIPQTPIVQGVAHV